MRANGILDIGHNGAASTARADGASPTAVRGRFRGHALDEEDDAARGTHDVSHELSTEEALGVPRDKIARVFDEVKRFHAQPVEKKLAL